MAERSEFEFNDEEAGANHNVVLTYNKKLHGYRLDGAFKSVGCRLANDEDIVKYYMDKEEELFPDFDRITDYVTSNYHGNKTFLVHRRHDLTRVNAVVEPGMYTLRYVDGEGFHLFPMKLPAEDKYIDLRNFDDDLIDSDMDQFFAKKEVYGELNMKHRRGLLLYGPHGNGKTMNILRFIKEAFRKHNAVAIFVDGGIKDFETLLPFRDAFKGRNIIFIIEEILDRSEDGMDSLLSFLDGELSWNDAYIVSTTNYPEKLPDNLIDRPGRFDLLVEMDNPSAEARSIYLGHFFPDAETLKAMVRETDGFSVAYIREMVLRAKMKGMEPLAAIKELKKVKAKIKKHFDKKRQEMGFGATDDDDEREEVPSRNRGRAGFGG